jgi:endonuclease YncB( thermonuclease family)
VFSVLLTALLRIPCGFPNPKLHEPLYPTQTMLKIIKKSSLCALLFLAITAAHAFEGRIVGVADGDTVTVLDGNNRQHKIRIGGIDSPEKSQDFGARAKKNLSDLVFGKTVSIPESRTDKYGRTVSRVLVGGTDAGLEQIKAGMAWHYKQYEREQSPADRASYSAAEQSARSQRLGLWAQPNPQRPSEFRHGDASLKQVAQTASNSECPCGAANYCTGPRGGQFCLTGAGKKEYSKH